jgi:hypothetical protein
MMYRKPACSIRRRSKLQHLRRAPLGAMFFNVAVVLACCPLCVRGQTSDRSWPVAQYVRIGMPDPGKFWTASDYATFCGLLHALDRTNRAAFPRLDSPNSGALLARVMNPTNTVYCLEADVPADVRLRLFQSLLTFIPSILDMYKLSGMDATFPRETVELAHTHLRLLRLAIEQDGKPMPHSPGWPPMHLRELTISPWNSQGSPDDFIVPRNGSFEVLGAHAAVTLAYLLPWLGDRTVIPDPERLAATRYLNEDVPLLWEHIAPPSRTRLTEDLVAVIERTRPGEIRQGLENLRKQLTPTKDGP